MISKRFIIKPKSTRIIFQRKKVLCFSLGGKKTPQNKKRKTSLGKSRY
jgi:hypothetical protein